jgi:hypothetical protein
MLTMLNDLINAMVNGIINFANDLLMPVMILVFACAVVMRVLIFMTIKREEWFAKAFQKRVYDYLEKKPENAKHTSFYISAKTLLEKTYYELFIMRAVMKRRNPDVILELTDRVFMVQQGCARLVKDTLKHVKYFRYDMHRPNTMQVSASIIEKNPQFNKILGYFPMGTFNEVLNLLPGIFIVGGIFGTFLGIMKALPELGAMDLADIEKTKQVMDHFLVKMSYSMITSILGICLNVAMTFLNAFMNPSKIFMDIVERFENSLDTLWNCCSDNKLPSEIPQFDEHRDPIDALAEDAVNKEVMKSKEYVAELGDKEDQKIKEIVQAGKQFDDHHKNNKAA